jgi:tetratricopeptide (TPR) repeat protein
MLKAMTLPKTRSSLMWTKALLCSLVCACPISALASPTPPEAFPAAAQYGQADKTPEPVATPPVAETSEQRLDRLYDQLRTAKTPQQAEPFVRQVEASWHQQGGAAAALLTNRAMTFASRGKFDEALVLMDQAVLLQPQFAEAWQRRARLHLQKSRNQRAMLDIREALRSEPRHYQAWATLGRLLEDADQPVQALGAYRRALGLNPHLDAIRERADKLASQVRGLSL